MLVSQVSKGVNGPIMELLASACDYHDSACIDIFRNGGVLFGSLPAVGNGVASSHQDQFEPDLVTQNRRDRNQKVGLPHHVKICLMR